MMGGLGSPKLYNPAVVKISDISELMTPQEQTKILEISQFMDDSTSSVTV
jgi:hypothetical protein